jgi:hypothetical protein
MERAVGMMYIETWLQKSLDLESKRLKPDYKHWIQVESKLLQPDSSQWTGAGVASPNQKSVSRTEKRTALINL